MLKNLCEEIRECLRHAALCNLMAKTARNPSAIQDYLEMELRWLQLARNYEFTERLSKFVQRDLFAAPESGAFYQALPHWVIAPRAT